MPESTTAPSTAAGSAPGATGTSGVADGPGTATPPASKPWLKVFGVIVGLALAVSAMVLAFLAPAINSGPHDLPIAISGPAAATEPLRAALDQKQPGAFEFTEHETLDSVADAVHDRDAVGGISITGAGTATITVAGGAGAPYGPLMRRIGTALEAQGVNVSIDDIAPLTAEDPNGSGLAALGLPLAFGGMISAVLLSTLLRHRPVHRLIGSVLASIAVGFAVTAILQFGFGSIDGDYVLTSLALGLGVSAISLFVLGMESLFGYAGLGIGGITMMFIANPLAGMASGWQWLPDPWGFIGQLLPIGASGTLLRSTAFFDGHGTGMPVLVLGCWAALGILLVGASAIRKRRARARARAV